MIESGLAPNEGGVVTDRFGSFGPGFFLWLAAGAVGLIGSIACAFLATRATGKVLIP